jgi:hypothetical protein
MRKWTHSSTNLDLSTRWQWVVSFMPLPLYPLVVRRLGGPQSRSGHHGEGISCPWQESNPGRPAEYLSKKKKRIFIKAAVTTYSDLMKRNKVLSLAVEGIHTLAPNRPSIRRFRQNSVWIIYIFRYLGYILSNDWLTDKWWIWKDAVVAKSTEKSA